MPCYGLENVIESYYSPQIASWLSAGADYQLVVDPAYNHDRSRFLARVVEQTSKWLGVSGRRNADDVYETPPA